MVFAPTVVRTFLRETRVVFARSMRLSLRNPIWVIIGLGQPILYVVLFGPCWRRSAASSAATPGRSSSPACSCS